MPAWNAELAFRHGETAVYEHTDSSFYADSSFYGEIFRQGHADSTFYAEISVKGTSR